MFRFPRIGLRDEGILFTSPNLMLGPAPEEHPEEAPGKRKQMVAFHGIKAKRESQPPPKGAIPTWLQAQGDGYGKTG